MKIIFFVLCLSSVSCAIKINPDGSKDVTVDATALAAGVNAWAASKTPPVATPVTPTK